MTHCIAQDPAKSGVSYLMVGRANLIRFLYRPPLNPRNYGGFFMLRDGVHLVVHLSLQAQTLSTGAASIPGTMVDGTILLRIPSANT
jgi:hypothetical protein